MSSASDLASALAKIIPQNPVSDSMRVLLEGAFSSLDSTMTQLSGNAGLDSLAAMLIPRGAPSERKMVDVADRLIACLPSEVTLLAGLLDTDSVSRGTLNQLKQLWTYPNNLPQAQAGALSTDQLSRALSKALQDLGAQGSSILGLHDDLSLMTADVMQTLAVAGPGWTSSGAQKSIIKQLNKWIGRIKGWGGIAKKTSAVADEIAFELQFRYPVRLAVASVLSVGAHLLVGENELENDIKELTRGRPSSTGLGADIHRRYQKDYRQARLVDLIEQDDLVYGLGIQSFQGRKLGDVAFSSSHLELAGMYVARQSLKPIDLALSGAPPAEKMLNWSMRDDNANFTDECLFEIKPVRGAWLGVVQEMYYRSSFNMWMAIFQDFSSLPVALAKIFGTSAASQHIMCEKLRPGVAADWPEANAARRGVQRFVKNGRVFAVMGASVDALPGLLLYWIFDIPIAALKLIYDTLRDTFNKLANKVQAIVIEVYTWVTAIAIATVAVLLLVAAVASGAAEISALVAALARLGIALPAAVASGLTGFQQALQGFSKQWIITAASEATSGVVRLRLEPEATIDPTVLMTGIQVGFLRIEMIPVDAAKYFGAVVQAGLAMTGVASPATV